jgi:ABC transporter substrate binding protein
MMSRKPISTSATMDPMQSISSSPFLSALYREMIDLSELYQFPAIYQWKEHVEAGGLVSFGPNLASLWRQAGTIVAKVLKGATPAEIPIEQPTKFELAVNTRTAKGLKIQLPPTILVRADDLFECEARASGVPIAASGYEGDAGDVDVGDARSVLVTHFDIGRVAAGSAQLVCRTKHQSATLSDRPTGTTNANNLP